MTAVVGVDFPASGAGFRDWYGASGLSSAPAAAVLLAGPYEEHTLASRIRAACACRHYRECLPYLSRLRRPLPAARVPNSNPEELVGLDKDSNPVYAAAPMLTTSAFGSAGAEL
jgi:hypothetical protein